MTALLSASLMMKSGSGGSGGGVQFLAVADDSTVGATSPDGITWTARTLPGISGNCIAWNGNTFVVFQATGSSMTYSTDGSIWSTASSGADREWTGLSWGSAASLFVAVNKTIDGSISTSPNGSAWTYRTPIGLAGSSMAAIAYNGSIFCAIQDSSSGVHSYTSSDGINWTSHTGIYSVSSIAWNGSLFFGPESGGSNHGQTSPNGITWTSRTMSSNHTWTSVAWNGSVFCAICNDAAIAATSPDGITWTDRTMPGNQPWSSIAWNGSVFCAVANTASAANTSAATSPDGITWTYRTMPGIQKWSAICAQRTLP